MKQLSLFVLFTILLLSTAKSLAREAQPDLTFYPSQGADSLHPTPAVIVCPGGSYSWLDDYNEGELVARWLQQQGIAAFVLRYPVQGVTSFIFHYRWFCRGHQFPDALLALQQAIRQVRSQATSYHINPHCVGAMGFSAGGHLVVNAAESFTSADDCPDFVCSVYPVVTLRANPWVHKRSRRALLGEYRKHSTRWRDSLSLELHVRPDMPPVFLVNCLDDPIVHYHNSELLDSALTAHGIPHEYHQYRTGGHSFGASDAKGTEECREWRTAFLTWLHNVFSNI